jgi:hypothetical protein
VFQHRLKRVNVMLEKMYKCIIIVQMIIFSLTASTCMAEKGLRIYSNGSIQQKFSLEGTNVSLPYHSAYWARVNIEPYTQDTKLTMTLFLRNESLCSGYMERSYVTSLFAGSWQITPKFSIGCGDMGRVSIGHGLTFHEFEAEGFWSKCNLSDCDISFKWLAAGLTTNEDVWLLSWSQQYFDKLNVVSTIGYLPFDSWYKYDKNGNKYLWIYDQYLGSVAFTLPFNYEFSILGSVWCPFVIFGEVASSLCKGGKMDGIHGLAYLVGIELTASIPYKNTRCKYRIEHRKYQSGFDNLYYASNYRNYYYGQDTENKLINNWQNYLRYDGDVCGYACLIDGEWIWSKRFSLIVKEEIVAINYDDKKWYIELRLLACVKINVHEYANILLGVSNNRYDQAWNMSADAPYYLLACMDFSW